MNRKFVIGGAALGLCVLLLAVFVWTSGVFAAPDQPPGPAGAPPGAQKAGPKEETSALTPKEKAVAYDKAVYGMSKEHWDEVQGKFVGGLDK